MLNEELKNLASGTLLFCNGQNYTSVILFEQLRRTQNGPVVDCVELCTFRLPIDEDPNHFAFKYEATAYFANSRDFRAIDSDSMAEYLPIMAERMCSANILPEEIDIFEEVLSLNIDEEITNEIMSEIGKKFPRYQLEIA